MALFPLCMTDLVSSGACSVMQCQRSCCLVLALCLGQQCALQAGVIQVLISQVSSLMPSSLSALIDGSEVDVCCGLENISILISVLLFLSPPKTVYKTERIVPMAHSAQHKGTQTGTEEEAQGAVLLWIHHEHCWWRAARELVWWSFPLQFKPGSKPAPLTAPSCWLDHFGCHEQELYCSCFFLHSGLFVFIL